MEISGKTFLVTGGAQGMGRCFTLELANWVQMFYFVI